MDKDQIGCQAKKDSLKRLEQLVVSLSVLDYLCQFVVTPSLITQGIVQEGGKMNTPEPEVKRWTAKRKTKLVSEILKGKTTVAELRSQAWRDSNLA